MTTSTSISSLSRRDFIKAAGVSAGALSLGLNIPASVAEAIAPDQAANLGVFVTLNANDEVTIVCQRMEMGQGIITSVPQIIADEMRADWQHVNAVLGNADVRYGSQNTGGSASIRLLFTHIRQMGAIARVMLEQAAANRWDVPVADVEAKGHQVHLKGSSKRLGFGALAADAAKLPVPDASSVSLVSINDYEIVGKDVGLLRQEEIVRGTLPFAQDVQLPGMLIASVERPPSVGGRVKSFDASEAKKVKGVVDVIKLKDRSFPVNVKPLSGVAVLATNSWAALEGRKKLKVEWQYDEGLPAANAKHDTTTYREELIEKVKSKGAAVRNQGDVYAHEYDADKTIEAVYTVPYHNHTPMETPSATATIEGDTCTVWSGTQAPQWGKTLVLEELGLDPKTDGDKVVFNTRFMGGAFGRKSKNDFTLEAVELAKASGKPVKVVWTREDDIKHGFYHSISANYYKAELNDKGSADYLISRVAHPPILSIFNHQATTARPAMYGQSFADVPFDMANVSCEKKEVEAHVRIGWLRAVQNIHNAFAMGSFVDELAAKADIPTHKMWRNLLGKDRELNFKELGFEDWGNYQFGSDGLGLLPTTKRMKNVLDVVVKKSGADKKTAKNEGWGISFCYSFGAFAAAASKVRVVGGKDSDKVEVLEMHTAIDCGLIITPDRVKSQMEGAMIMGLAVALYGEITVKEGAVEQSNFHDYLVARMPQVPPLYVHLVDSDEVPGGVGEPGMSPVAPSITNAIFHACGKRVRDLPVKNTLEV